MTRLFNLWPDLFYCKLFFFICGVIFLSDRTFLFVSCFFFLLLIFNKLTKNHILERKSQCRLYRLIQGKKINFHLDMYINQEVCNEILIFFNKTKLLFLWLMSMCLWIPCRAVGAGPGSNPYNVHDIYYIKIKQAAAINR